MDTDMDRPATKPILNYIARLKLSGGLKSSDIGNFTGASTETVLDWESGQKPPPPKIQLLISRLLFVAMRLNEYYDQNEVRAWLYAQHPQFSGQRAIDLIKQERTEEVLAVLDRLDADAYV